MRRYQFLTVAFIGVAILYALTTESEMAIRWFAGLAGLCALLSVLAQEGR